MKEEYEELKKLAKSIQDFIASNATIDKIEIELNKITVSKSDVVVIRTHRHSTDLNDVPKHTFLYK